MSERKQVLLYDIETMGVTPSRRSTLQRSRVLVIGMIGLACLAGCASHSEHHVQFFKAYTPGQAVQGSLPIITVSQTDQAPASTMPRAGRP